MEEKSHVIPRAPRYFTLSSLLSVSAGARKRPLWRREGALISLPITSTDALPLSYYNETWGAGPITSCFIGSIPVGRTRFFLFPS